MTDQIISQEGYEKLKNELEYLKTTKRREIAELSQQLKNLIVVGGDGKKNEVGMGSKITVETGGKIKEYTIVSFNEVDPLLGKISNESPIGQAFLGKKKDATVIVSTPRGEIEYRIVDIQ